MESGWVEEKNPIETVNIEGEEEEVVAKEVAAEEVAAKEVAFLHSAEGGKWSEVIDDYNADKRFHTLLINKRRGTALHIAVHDGVKDVAMQLVEAIVNLNNEDALKSKNESGDTPLHLAATRGFNNVCETIIGEKKERMDLVNIDNELGETPLFLSTLSCQIHSFQYLCSMLHSQGVNVYRNLIRDNGDTILHCAIQAEFMDLALIIIGYFPELCNIQNKKGFSPLKVLATKPDAFMSGCNYKLEWWKKIIYQCLNVEDLDVKWEISHLEKTDETVQNVKPGGRVNSRFNMLPEILTFIRGGNGMKQQSSENNEHKISLPLPSSDSKQVTSKCSTLHEFKKFAYTSILDIPEMVFKISEIRKMKQKHIWSGQLLLKLMEKPEESYLGSGGRPYWEDEHELDFYHFINNTMHPDKEKQEEKNEEKETPILTATRNGIVEMVDKFLSELPSSLHETTPDKRNILLVAVFNRQPSVVELLKQMLNETKWDNLIREADEKENTMLHLAAETLSKDKSWPVPGSAMQMMWDIKWFQYIQKQVPGHFNSKTNKRGKTAGEIFKESHEDLDKTSSEWLKDTSESCSVVAALIAGVSFATASTVPGGNGDNGIPPFEGQPAFDAFAISSLIGLCFSVSALIMFLSILTSRKQPKDFHRDLPLKLLLGLSSLFLSIIALFIAFCSGHFIILQNKYKYKIFPLYAATFIPVSFYAAAQFQLYADLIKTILNKVPRAVEKGPVL